MMYELPEPHEYVWNPDGTFNIGQERCLSTNTGPCHGWEIYPIFTDDQMQAAFAAGRASRDAEVSSCGSGAGCLYKEAKIDALQAEAEALRADAERYRWLREQDWFGSDICVLREPKRVLTSGIGLGADCPSHHRLDQAIDAAMSAQEKANG